MVTATSRFYVGLEDDHELWRCSRCDRVFATVALDPAVERLVFCRECLTPDPTRPCPRCGKGPMIPAIGLCEVCGYGANITV